MEMFRAEGFDVEGTLEWPVAWGDCDMFQYVSILSFCYLFTSSDLIFLIFYTATSNRVIILFLWSKLIQDT